MISGFLLFATQAASAFVVPAVGRGVAPCTRTTLCMQFDEEGGMVKEIAEGGQTLAEVKAGYGQAAPELAPEKQALCVLKEPEWNVAKMAVSATDEDFVLQTSSMGDATCEIVIEPPFNTYEDYIVGFTAESSDKISIVRDESSDIEGRTDRRGGEPLVFKIKYEPQGQDGVAVSHLCCIYPEEKMYSKFYEIKGMTDGASDAEATRDSSSPA
eukprot:CAMPEP_0174717084 /NCGR_PEP_ID=MMETSP1094-20130205/25813_1 /TAXON_ID=156173 /ORGANISM="Chrysochromulina brevifilum, Strain UTEX LB 985" /LENGTH=212 /DNA_ID=CAMNT_0015916973 /DNA_START=15 /DNA_END=653 /DNA_ORIENTATION=+